MNMPISKSESDALDAIAADIAKVQPPDIDGAAQDAATVNESATAGADYRHRVDTHYVDAATVNESATTMEVVARDFLRDDLGREPSEAEVRDKIKEFGGDSATVNDSAVKVEAAKRDYARDFLIGSGVLLSVPLDSEIKSFTLGYDDGVKRASRINFAGNRSDSYRPREDPEPFDEFTGPCEERSDVPEGYETLSDSNIGGIVAAAIAIGAGVVVLGMIAYFAFGGAA